MEETGLAGTQAGPRQKGIRHVRWNSALVLILCSLGYDSLAARDHLVDYESGRPSATTQVDAATGRVVRPPQVAGDPHAGQLCLHCTVESLAPQSSQSLIQPVPRCRLLEELNASAWVKSDREGARLLVRVRLPRQPDPVTGQPLAVLVPGEVYTDTGRWQQLACGEIESRFLKMLPRIRKRLQTETGSYPNLDLADVLVDAVVIEFEGSRGVTALQLDDVQIGPVIAAEPDAQIQSIEYREESERAEAEFHLGRLFVGGKPFFPRMVPYHGESAGDLAGLRFNVAWVPDYRDTLLLDSLRGAGLRGMAIPPRPGGEGRGAAQLAPFGPETSGIMLWYLGTGIRPEVKKQLLDWEEQIRNADRTRRRPVMGDVLGQEREYSRHLAMLGVSRAPLQTSLGLQAYREFLASRRRLAKQGSFFWTWVHTEPDFERQQQRLDAGQSPLVIEPEQLRLQVYSALAAGSHGLGFWTQTPLEVASDPATLERRLAIAQLNLELELLEPWLATGVIQGQAPFTAKLPAQRGGLGAAPGGAGAEAQQSDRAAQARQRQALSRELEATILRTDYSTLVLPIWYGEEAQFVPGQMAANDLQLVVPGVGEAATAWELSPTDVSRLVDSTRVAGGRQVGLRKFDMTTALLFTDDPRLIERLQAKVQELREPAARVAVELARTKLDRVNTTVITLQALRPQPDAPLVLARAREMLRRAELFLQEGRFHDARLAAADSLQLQRVLQRLYWNDAIQKMYAPVSSPHAVCFATLPDHWEMVSRFRLARESGTRNILRSGDFEDFDTMVTEGWRHERTSIDGVQSTAEVSPQAREGSYSLRLVAVAKPGGGEPPATVPQPPVTVTSPPLTVYRGQLLYITGWVRVTSGVTAASDGVMLWDSLGGQSLALRWRKPAEWQEFQLVREVHETRELTLSISLTGLGEVYFDDLKVIPLSEGTPEESEGTVAPVSKPAATNPLDFFKKIPGFRPKTPDEE